jgi:hypothetical protein
MQMISQPNSRYYTLSLILNAPEGHRETAAIISAVVAAFILIQGCVFG